MRIDFDKLLDEVTFNFSRSGGKGGQNVNKVETKVELVFNVHNSPLLDEELRARLIKKLSGKLDNEGNLHVVSQSERSQSANRKEAQGKFISIIQNALKKEKKRIRTRRPEAAKQRTLDAKRKLGEKKKIRKRPEHLE